MARKILLADDSVTAQNMGRKILADAGYEVITVNNGSAALKKIAEVKPELIILDVYMPGYSGLEVCQRLKDAPESSRIPVLLSVGKLEPFKPDEAKRVRADGYIVKPFEASELLSALSKLEDQIVPKAETGKPGRMARTVAGADEAERSSDNVRAGGSTWKDRISFPGKKEAAEENSDDGALYNAVNGDLKKVVQPSEPMAHSAPPPETKLNQAEQDQAKQDQAKQDQAKLDQAKLDQAKLDQVKQHDTATARSEEKLVDLGALATAGLPKDVTTEEIAALAAAAAHVQGRKLGTEGPQNGAAEGIRAERKIAPREQAPVAAAETKPSAEKDQERLTRGPSEAEVTAAIARLTEEEELGQDRRVEAKAVPADEERGPQSSAETAGEELPVTMAAAPISSNAGGLRWTAVPVAVDAAEAAISLEREMRLTFSAFATAAAAQAGPATVAAEPHAPEIDRGEAVRDSAPPAQGTVAATAPAQRPAPAPSAEAASAQIKEFAVARGPETADNSEMPDYSACMPAARVDAMGETLISQTEAFAPGLGISEESGVVANETQLGQTRQQPMAATGGQPAISSGGAIAADLVAGTISGEEVLGDVDIPRDEAVPDRAAQGFVTESAVVQGEVLQSEAVRSELPETQLPETQIPVNHEAELAASAAAAWASWRQIRDSIPESNTTNAGEHANREPAQDFAPLLAPAALAVAAGAETSHSEASAPVAAAPKVDSQAVASIVDNLLAELRPKIVEEISRKLGEKK